MHSHTHSGVLLRRHLYYAGEMKLNNTVYVYCLVFLMYRLYVILGHTDSIHGDEKLLTQFGIYQ